MRIEIAENRSKSCNDTSKTTYIFEKFQTFKSLLFKSDL